MTLFDLALAISVCDAALMQANLDPIRRQQILNDFSDRLARAAMKQSDPVLNPKESVNGRHADR